MAAFIRPISTKKMLQALNGVIRLTYDLIHSYDTAIEQSADPDRHRMFRQLQAMHERHCLKLADTARYLGGNPANSYDWRQWITRAKAYLAGIGSEHELLWAVYGNEQKLRETMRQTIREFATCDDLVSVLREVLADSDEYEQLKEAAVGKKSSVTGNYR
ncbi:MAG: DUF2383 domain-containing protein [Halomonadaceae bacterium]|nr:MAG: DUF2383 domain-containing protein [Halomonadaceae bacterium]